MRRLIRWILWKLKRGKWFKKELRITYWTHKDFEAEVELKGIYVRPVNDLCRIDDVYIDRCFLEGGK